MGLSRANEQFRDGSNDARLAGASLTSNELAELGGFVVVVPHPVKLATYQLQRYALSLVQCEGLGHLPSGLAKGCGCAEHNARRWTRIPRWAPLIGMRGRIVLLAEPVGPAVRRDSVGGCCAAQLILQSLDHLLLFAGETVLLRLDGSQLLLPGDLCPRD